MFEEMKGKLGFGLMRLPMINDDPNYEEVNKMVDRFIEEGFNYFDTAHGYINGKSEHAAKICLANRYPREKFMLTNKLTDCYFNSKEDIIPFFNSQLETCGVSYFDVYLMHAQNKRSFEHFKKCEAYETCFELKKLGKIKHFGISFHDSAEVLEMILKEYPEIEIVQIQLNYLDFDDPIIQSKKCYDVCEKYNKAAIIMEPVKGGSLVNLPKEGQAIIDKLDGSAASFAIRFAAGFKNVKMVLSGMSNLEQMNDNLSYMKNYQKLNEYELSELKKVKEIILKKDFIACTNCRYCVAGCPKNILIPDLFSSFNLKISRKEEEAKNKYLLSIQNNGKPMDCIECQNCEKTCPQHLEIRNYLKRIQKEFE